jgi:hypothetical protein
MSIDEVITCLQQEKAKSPRGGETPVFTSDGDPVVCVELRGIPSDPAVYVCSALAAMPPE